LACSILPKSQGYIARPNLVRQAVRSAKISMSVTEQAKRKQNPWSIRIGLHPELFAIDFGKGEFPLLSHGWPRASSVAHHFEREVAPSGEHRLERRAII
jgi:hypothetical protein